MNKTKSELSNKTKPALSNKTKGEIESEICEALIKFEREYMGRGPEEARTYILDDLIIVRLRGVLTPAERQLVKSEVAGHGRNLIKQVRMELIEKARPLLEVLVHDITGQHVKSLHTDISTATGERIIVFSLARPYVFQGATADILTRCVRVTKCNR
ncbi:MAG: DUF2294 domain-containing protein [bacterium]|jgi:uncharacterized protein YbcI